MAYGRHGQIDETSPSSSSSEAPSSRMSARLRWGTVWCCAKYTRRFIDCVTRGRCGENVTSVGDEHASNGGSLVRSLSSWSCNKKDSGFLFKALAAERNILCQLTPPKKKGPSSRIIFFPGGFWLKFFRYRRNFFSTNPINFHYLFAIKTSLTPPPPLPSLSTPWKRWSRS